MTEILFTGWRGVGRVALVALCAYPALVLMLRLSGKRTLAKMNAFDLVVTVALGSTLASTLTSKTVALAEGMTALAMLILLQVVVAYSASRSDRANRAFKSEPRLLVHGGRLLLDAMRAERVTRDDIEGAIRQQGLHEIEQVHAVVLESNGSLSVTPASRGPR